MKHQKSKTSTVVRYLSNIIGTYVACTRFSESSERRYRRSRWPALLIPDNEPFTIGSPVQVKSFDIEHSAQVSRHISGGYCAVTLDIVHGYRYWVITRVSQQDVETAFYNRPLRRALWPAKRAIYRSTYN